MKISVAIITYNEERNIARCLASVKPVADEIIVVDSMSKDNTKAFCMEHGVRFVEHAFEGHIQQKNYAASQATHEYVLSLDADEVLSAELQQSILELKQKDSLPDAFSMNRLTNYCGRWIRHSGWYPDRKLRLWRKEKGKWGGINPHDTVVLNPEVTRSHLKGNLLHYSYYSIHQHIEKMNLFTDIAAKEAFRRKDSMIPVVHLFLYPALRFMNTYFLKAGFLDGYQGLVLSILDGHYRFMKYAKLRELRRGTAEKSS